MRKADGFEPTFRRRPRRDDFAGDSSSIPGVHMTEDLSDSVPCSSIAVDSSIRLGAAGAIWGSCFGPYESRKLGLTRGARMAFIAKSIGHNGISCAIFSFTHCGIQRYRHQKDLVSTFAAGAIAGAAFGAGTGNWKQAAAITGLFCTIFHFAKDSTST
ncbi:hypothetical protein M569_15434 [Genlisea aurea]|uniref:Uncharacterized protein n=1 Tax=Genlisea aurea TaxID=192259 RepID=S8BYC5_9LAMI|nr:hypothetical protein M569_15434 [Genlisea aurea]